MPPNSPIFFNSPTESIDYSSTIGSPINSLDYSSTIGSDNYPIYHEDDDDDNFPIEEQEIYKSVDNLSPLKMVKNVTYNENKVDDDTPTTAVTTISTIQRKKISKHREELNMTINFTLKTAHDLKTLYIKHLEIFNKQSLIKKDSSKFIKFTDLLSVLEKIWNHYQADPNEIIKILLSYTGKDLTLEFNNKFNETGDKYYSIDEILLKPVYDEIYPLLRILSEEVKELSRKNKKFETKGTLSRLKTQGMRSLSALKRERGGSNKKSKSKKNSKPKRKSKSSKSKKSIKKSKSKKRTKKGNKKMSKKQRRK